MENILNLLLIHFLESQEYFTPYQYGFCKNRSTAGTLVRLETGILNAFARKQQFFSY